MRGQGLDMRLLHSSLTSRMRLRSSDASTQRWWRAEGTTAGWLPWSWTEWVLAEVEVGANNINNNINEVNVVSLGDLHNNIFSYSRIISCNSRNARVFPAGVWVTFLVSALPHMFRGVMVVAMGMAMAKVVDVVVVRETEMERPTWGGVAPIE